MLYCGLLGLVRNGGCTQSNTAIGTESTNDSHDVTQAEELIDGLYREYVVADRVYDSNQFIE